jgi:hypothetical protein
LELQLVENIDKLLKKRGIEHGRAVHHGSAVGELSDEPPLARHDLSVGCQKLKSLDQDVMLAASKKKTCILGSDME